MNKRVFGGTRFFGYFFSGKKSNLWKAPPAKDPTANSWKSITVKLLQSLELKKSKAVLGMSFHHCNVVNADIGIWLLHLQGNNAFIAQTVLYFSKIFMLQGKKQWKQRSLWEMKSGFNYFPINVRIAVVGISRKWWGKERNNTSDSSLIPITQTQPSDKAHLDICFSCFFAQP